jgi:hypothetical protein
MTANRRSELFYLTYFGVRILGLIMSTRSAMSLVQSIDDHEGGLYSFLCDDNATSSVPTPDSTDGLHPWGVPPAFSNTPPDGTSGQAASAAAQLESEVARLKADFDGTLMDDHGLINGATWNPETPGNSEPYDEALASLVSSETNNAFPGAAARDDKFPDSNDDQDTFTFVCVDDGMGPGLLNNVADPGGHWPDDEPQHQGGSTPAAQDCGAAETETVSCAHAIIDELCQLLSCGDSPAEFGRFVSSIAETLHFLEGISSGNGDPGHANCQPLDDWREGLNHISGGGCEFASNLLENGLIDANSGAETAWHAFGHELLP